jgi:hypothetical protein
MLYIGLFGFYNEEKSTSNHFVYFAEANDPDGAVEIFKAGIKRTAKKPNVNILGDIYLDSFIELTKLPRGGAMAFLQAMKEDEASSIVSCVNPGGTPGLAGYQWSKDDKEPDYNDPLTPFLTIPAPKKRRLKRVEQIDP